MFQISSFPVFSGRLKNQQGFTLLELIIVCLLIAVSLAFSVPTLRQAMVIDQLAASSRKIIALIREVRVLAAQEQRPYLINFDLDRKKIWYQQDFPESKEEKEQTSPHPTIELPPSVRLQDILSGTADKKTSGEVTLWINKQGYMDQTVLHLADDQDNIISLVISPFFSTIKAYDSYINLE
ncbi:MAG: prepilin-type N-terminal cleavage/methylation domain-containing protein [Proteobacteria bacterium]|nr:prepilin-type N-terminal cleavage/methylation domain-containing protein [Pseudomonadota bacterium]MBU1650278.1 prepilin-type N-terminal cleavage/methylation domain-containing protein [Pseudomonadota bacterium]MBU1985894.1 prepilin-type N-terminal cleavage/methylation domain-containing protein [Pseudomonadota bacterium]